MNFKKNLFNFFCFNKFPIALFVSLPLFLGILFALKSFWSLLHFLIVCATLEKKKLLLFIAFFLLPIPLFHYFFYFPKDETKVTGIFHIQHFKQCSGHQLGWLYQGTLKCQKGLLCCSIHSKKFYSADCDYLISGIIHRRKEFFYQLKATKVWETVGNINFTGKRYAMQEKVKAYLLKNIPQKRASLFLVGLTIGKLEDQLLLKEFGSLGLSHILAISGFHFALLSAFLHVILSFFISYKIEPLILIFFLAIYLFFIGNAPSIERAFIGITIVLLGQLFGRKTNAVNTLAISLLIAIIFHPLSILTLSFQLSFLATAGILFFFHPIEKGLQLLIVRVSLDYASERNFIWKVGYLTATFFRKALALTLAVHVALLPLLLSYFHTFSLNSVIYNLFFPPLVSIGMMFALISFPFGKFLMPLVGSYFEKILTITENPPFLFKTFFINDFPDWLLALYFSVLLLAALYTITRRIEN